MLDIILNSITSVKTPIETVQLPVNIGNGFVNRREDGVYQIINTIQPLSRSPLNKKCLLVGKNNKHIVELISPKNITDSIELKAFDFKIDETVESGNYRVFLIETVDLFALDDWEAMNRIRFSRAQSAAAQLSYSSRPINQIVTVLNLIDKYTDLWESIVTDESLADLYNQSGSTFTPEDARRNWTDWKYIRDFLVPVAEYAVTNELVSPINPAEYVSTLRSIQCTMIESALNISGSILEEMTAEQISTIWETIEETLEKHASKIDASPAAVEDNKPEIPEEKKYSSTRGKKSKKESTESPASSPESQPTTEPTLETPLDEQLPIS